MCKMPATQKQNAASFQVHLEHMPRQTICQITKIHINNVKKNEIMQSMFFNYNKMKIKLNYERKYGNLQIFEN